MSRCIALTLRYTEDPGERRVFSFIITR